MLRSDLSPGVVGVVSHMESFLQEPTHTLANQNIGGLVHDVHFYKHGNGHLIVADSTHGVYGGTVTETISEDGTAGLQHIYPVNGFLDDKGMLMLTETGSILSKLPTGVVAPAYTGAVVVIEQGNRPPVSHVPLLMVSRCAVHRLTESAHGRTAVGFEDARVHRRRGAPQPQLAREEQCVARSAGDAAADGSDGANSGPHRDWAAAALSDWVDANSNAPNGRHGHGRRDADGHRRAGLFSRDGRVYGGHAASRL